MLSLLVSYCVFLSVDIIYFLLTTSEIGIFVRSFNLKYPVRVIVRVIVPKLA